MLIDFFFAQIHLLVYSFPNCFLGMESQSQIYAIESHPVDVFFPLLPRPPGRAVPSCAHILIIPETGFADILTLCNMQCNIFAHIAYEYYYYSNYVSKLV